MLALLPHVSGNKACAQALSITASRNLILIPFIWVVLLPWLRILYN